MGDHRAGSSGPTATTLGAPAKRAARHAIELVRDDATQQCASQPYVGRRIATVAPPPPDAGRDAEALPYAGRRVAGRSPVASSPTPAAPTSAAGPARAAGRRIALDATLGTFPDQSADTEDVVGHLLRPTAEPILQPYVGRRVKRPADLTTGAGLCDPVAVAVDPVTTSLVIASADRVPTVPALPQEARHLDGAVVDTPVLEELVLEDLLLEEPVLEELTLAEPVVEVAAFLAPVVLPPVEPLTEEPVAEEPVTEEPVAEEPVAEQPVVEKPSPLVLGAAEHVDPVLAVHPELRGDAPSRPTGSRAAPRQTRPGGRRAASRRTRVPSLPLLAGVAVLAISAGGALNAVSPDLAGAGTGADGRLSPASALSGSSAVGSASLLGGRAASVSRDSNRLAGGSDSLQAAADAQAKERDAALSVIAGQAEKQAAQIKLHQWVLPVLPGVYHLTARFGDYSSLWSHFHTGLDFAAPTGTPIMAVASGTITEVGYSGAYGDRTVETLADGTELWYCHQNSFGTSIGATVKPGQLIGYIGSTGNVTGPHLHLEVHPGGGDPVDPYTALVVHGLQP